MMGKFKPRIVQPEADWSDIYVNWRTEIASRNWESVHVSADRRQPIEIEDAPRRWWRA